MPEISKVNNTKPQEAIIHFSEIMLLTYCGLWRVVGCCRPSTGGGQHCCPCTMEWWTRSHSLRTAAVIHCLQRIRSHVVQTFSHSTTGSRSASHAHCSDPAPATLNNSLLTKQSPNYVHSLPPLSNMMDTHLINDRENIILVLVHPSQLEFILFSAHHLRGC